MNNIAPYRFNGKGVTYYLMGRQIQHHTLFMVILAGMSYDRYTFKKTDNVWLSEVS